MKTKVLARTLLLTIIIIGPFFLVGVANCDDFWGTPSGETKSPESKKTGKSKGSKTDDKKAATDDFWSGSSRNSSIDTYMTEREAKRKKEEAIAKAKAERAERERQVRLAEERRQEEAERREKEEEQMRRARLEQEESSHSSYTPSQGNNGTLGWLKDINKIDQQNQARAEAARRERERAEADRRDRENARTRQQNQDRQQLAQQQADRRAEEQARLQQQQQEQDRRQEQERRQQEQARKQAEAEAAKQAEAQRKKQAQEKYLQGMRAGIKLAATKCPDGEGKYYATGTRPHIKPEEVPCIDVHFRAYCPGNGNYTSGTAHNFVGMSGCFGDTYEINPKPPCKIDQVRIEVEKVVTCGGS